MRAPAYTLGLAVAVLLLSGCVPEQGPSAPPPSAAPAPSPSATPSPSPSPSDVGLEPTDPTPRPGAETPVDLGPGSHDVTCASLLDESTTAAFNTAAADGWSFSEDFEQTMIDQDHFLARFIEFGGVACQWGFPNTDFQIFQYAWSPIEEADARRIELEFAEQGFEQSIEPGGRQYCAPPDELVLAHDHCYLVAADDWFYSSDRIWFDMLVSQVRAG